MGRSEKDEGLVEKKGQLKAIARKKGEETLLPWHATGEGLEARQYGILLSSKSTQGE